MKIDHLVLNIEEKYQNEETTSIRQAGLPYEPKWGKGTKGFKVSNIWIGREYFELVHLLKQDGGGWMPEWVRMYNNGHRGLICLMLDVDNIYEAVGRAAQRGVKITEPEYLKFRWGFGLFTRTMPWMNSYFDFFEGVPIQIGLQQMKDQKSEDFMCQYMVPNAKENGITGIRSIRICGPFSDNDFQLIDRMFEHIERHSGRRSVSLLGGRQFLEFHRSERVTVRVAAACNNPKYTGSSVTIENVDLEIN